MSDLIEPNNRTAYFTFQGQPVDITKSGMLLFKAVFTQLGGYQSLTPESVLTRAQNYAALTAPIAEPVRLRGEGLVHVRPVAGGFVVNTDQLALLAPPQTQRLPAHDMAQAVLATQALGIAQ